MFKLQWILHVWPHILYNRTPQPGDQSRHHHPGTLPRQHATDTNQAAGPLQISVTCAGPQMTPGDPAPGRTIFSSSTRPPGGLSRFSNTFGFLYVQIHGKTYINSLHFFLIFYNTHIKPSNKSNRFVHFLSWKCILPLLRTISLSRNSVFFIFLYIYSMVGILFWALHKNIQYLFMNLIWFTTSLPFSL